MIPTCRSNLVSLQATHPGREGWFSPGCYTTSRPLRVQAMIAWTNNIIFLLQALFAAAAASSYVQLNEKITE